MYNRYVPSDAGYVRVTEEEPDRGARQSGRGLLGGLLGGKPDGAREAVKGFLGTLCPGGLDTGDILLALIVLLLILEDGDDLDVIITLGLMILFSLGER